MRLRDLSRQYMQTRSGGLAASARAYMLTALICFAPVFAAAAPHRAGEIVLDPEAVATVEGHQLRYQLGTLFVPENRENPGSRIIGVGFARIKALKPTGAPPVFWLPGGPGLSVLGAFTGEDAASRSRLKSWASYGTVGDLVVVEQRGYSTRGDMLSIEAPASPLDRPSSVKADSASMIALARAAVATHRDKDLSGYTIVQLAADVDDLRRALGYEKISLFGGSFASQWSLAIIRLHPDVVARAVLSSVEPLDGFDIPSQVYAAIQRLAFDADRDPRLAAYLPPGGLMAAVREVHERFAKGPIRVTLAGEAGGEPRTVSLGAEDFQLALTSHTDNDGAEWPAFMLSIYHRHYDAWARETIQARAAGDMALIRPLIDTSLGISDARRHRVQTDPALDRLGTWRFAIDIASAPAWPTPDLGEALRTPEESLTPVVFVHGDWDTSTPVENTTGLLPYFRNGHAIVVHRGGHDGPFYQLREQPAVKAALYDFLRTGDAKGLPVSVTLSPPEFSLPDFAAPDKLH
jgi:pimeloyl-ACP methyl ester carboxylesterase